MHLLGPAFLGIVILLLLGALVVVKQIATGFILDKPQGSLLVQLVNIFNLFFLLIVDPLAAIGLITGSLPRIDPTHVAIDAGWILMFLEILGLLLYVIGFVLMGWALLTLRHNYQLGGSTPRSEDHMVVNGPYAFIRHPMYSAALSISLGLACVIQSLAFFAVFVIYLALMFGLIPLEERELEKAYGAKYIDYQRQTKMLIPAIY
jgi:protein-S-isoprenylcysteine O-methyltransferase Ste14